MARKNWRVVDNSRNEGPTDPTSIEFLDDKSLEDAADYEKSEMDNKPVTKEIGNHNISYDHDNSEKWYMQKWYENEQ